MIKYILVLSFLYPVSGFGLTISNDCVSLFEQKQDSKENIKFLVDPKDGFTNRYFVGSKPARTAPAEIAAMRQGGKWWGVSLIVKKSLEEARNHDSKFKSLSKIAYIISDFDTSQFNDDTPREKIITTFEQLMKDSDVYFFEEKDASGNELPTDQRIAVKQSKDILQKILIPEDVIWFTKDERGNRFHFFGWTFSNDEHGVVDYNHIFKLVETPVRNGPKVGMIANADIRRSLRILVSFLKDGGTITFNENFEESLVRAREQLRKNSKGEMERGSRYMIDPSAFPITLQNYKDGYAFSSEARINGDLKAGSIALKIDNMVTSDTVFYLTAAENTDGPNGTGKNYSDLARAVGIAEAIRLHRFGINFEDVGMVTSFTKQGGGIMVPADKFKLIKDYINSLPAVSLDELTKPFTLAEILFEPWQYGGN